MAVHRGITPERLAALQEISASLGIMFSRIQLLHQALTHTSYANEIKRSHIEHNERLEFLGDAVLELIVSSYLYEHFPNLPEGELTKARAAIVCEATLAKRAALLEMGNYLLFGRGERATGGKRRASILADAFEAVIGAIYLDHGIEAATSFVLGQLREDLSEIASGNYTQDYKTVLQEVVQKNSDNKVSYEILSETGPDHNKRFHIAVLVNDVKYGSGLGKSKKEAEQHAAKEALERLNQVDK